MLFPLVFVTSSDRRFTNMYSGDGGWTGAPEPTWDELAIVITAKNTGTLLITVLLERMAGATASAFFVEASRAGYRNLSWCESFEGR